jgi:hypothetical protein
MRKKTRKFEDKSSVEFLLLRESLGLGRYRKQRVRDEGKSRILMDLALKKIREKEEDDFLLVAEKRRKLRI